MSAATVAIVATDPSLRAAVAQAFDTAPATWAISFYDAAPPDADVIVFAAPEADAMGSEAQVHRAASQQPRSDGVVFESGHPERLVPAIQARLDRSVPVAPCRVAVVTGIAGSGVSSIAMHLALSWAGRFEACFIDLDRTWTCADRLGLGAEVITWGSAAESAEALRLASVPIEGGLRALVAPRTALDFSGDTLVQRARSQFQQLVVDLPYHHLESDRIAAVDATIVVMAPCIPHAHRVARMLTQIDADRVVVVTNRLGRGGETTRRQIEAIVGHKVALELPCCPGLRDAEGTQRLAPLRWSRWGHGVMRLARALERS
jgi:hypothetical protein